jgi:hypothetical protein
MEGCQLVLLLGLLVWLASCDPQVGHDLSHALQHSIVHMPTDVLDRLYTQHDCVTVMTIWEANQMSEQSWEASLEVLESTADPKNRCVNVRIWRSWLTGGQSSLERLSVVGTSVLLSCSSMSYTNAVRMGRNISLAGALNGLKMALYTA